MDQVTKWLGVSKTFWGIAMAFATAAAPGLASFTGWAITSGQIADLAMSGTEIIGAFGGLAGAVWAIYGTIVSKGPKTILPSA